MTRHGFTLLEVLVTVTLSSALVAIGGTWLWGLQRSAQSTRAQSGIHTRLMRTAMRMRQDALHAMPDTPLGSRNGQGDWLMAIAGAHGGPSESVQWRLQDGTATRLVRPAAGGETSSETVATGIDTMEIVTKGVGVPHVRVSTGTTIVDLPIMPGRADGT